MVKIAGSFVNGFFHLVLWCKVGSQGDGMVGVPFLSRNNTSYIWRDMGILAKNATPLCVNSWFLHSRKTAGFRLDTSSHSRPFSQFFQNALLWTHRPECPEIKETEPEVLCTSKTTSFAFTVRPSQSINGPTSVEQKHQFKWDEDLYILANRNIFLCTFRLRSPTSTSFFEVVIQCPASHVFCWIMLCVLAPWHAGGCDWLWLWNPPITRDWQKDPVALAMRCRP